MGGFIERYQGRFDFLCDYRQGGIAELATSQVPTVVGTPKLLRGELVSKNYAHYLDYGDNFDIDDWSRPFVIVLDFDVTNMTSSGFAAPVSKGVTGAAWFVQAYGGGAGGFQISIQRYFNITQYVVNKLNAPGSFVTGKKRCVVVFEVDGTWSATSVQKSIFNGAWYGSDGAVTGAVPATNALQNGSTFKVGATNSVTWPLNTNVRLIAKIDGSLTGAELQTIYRELVAGPSIVRRPSRHFSLPYPAKTPAEYAAEGIIVDLPAGRMSSVDNCGNAITAPVDPGADLERGGPFGEVTALRQTTGAAGTKLAPDVFVPASFGVNGGSMQVWLKGPTTSTTEMLACVQTQNNFGLAICASDPNTNAQVENGATSYNRGLITNTGFPAWTCVCVAGDKLGNRFFTTNGVAYNMPIAGGTLGTVPGTFATVGHRPPVQTTFPVASLKYAGFKVWDRMITPAEARAEYLKGARKCLLDARVHSDGSCPVSLAAVGAGSELANGWKVQSGTWKVVEDAPSGGRPGKRWLNRTTTGYIATRNDSAYGVWSGTVKMPISGYMRLYFVSKDGTGRTASTDSCYYWYSDATGAVVLMKYIAGSLNLLVIGETVTPGAYYNWMMTRRFDGLMQLWLKPIASSTWKKHLSATDTTATESKFFLVEADLAAAAETVDGVTVFSGEMTPFEAIKEGLIDGVIPDPFWTVTTTDTTQNWTMRLTSGAVYVFDWGDGQQTWHTGTGADQAIAHTYASAGTYSIKLYAQPSNILRLTNSSNSLSGTLEDLEQCVSQDLLYAFSNNLSGTIPSLTKFPAMKWFNVSVNAFTGTLPVTLAGSPLLSYFIVTTNPGVGGTMPITSGNPALTLLLCSSLNLSGSIKSITNNTALSSLQCAANNLTAYEASVISTTCIDFQAQSNALTQSAVDQILADFETNVAARPAAGTIVLNGGTNAAPSAAGLASKAAILLAKPGWTILNN